MIHLSIQQVEGIQEVRVKAETAPWLRTVVESAAKRRRGKLSDDERDSQYT